MNEKTKKILAETKKALGQAKRVLAFDLQKREKALGKVMDFAIMCAKKYLKAHKDEEEKWVDLYGEPELGLAALALYVKFGLSGNRCERILKIGKKPPKEMFTAFREWNKSCPEMRKAIEVAVNYSHDFGGDPCDIFQEAIEGLLAPGA